MGTIDISSVLTSWYNAKAGLITTQGSTGDTSNAGTALTLLGGTPTSTSSASGTSSAKPTHPTPPWSSGSTAPQLSALVQSVLDGQKFINPTAAKLDVPDGSATTNQNYKDLFALYQGLTALNGLVKQSAASNVSATQMAKLQQTLQSGLQQVQSFVATRPFSGFQVFQGAAIAADKSTVAVTHETDVYTGGTLYSGPVNTEIPAFQGPVQFTLTAAKATGPDITVNFDLSEMGAAPRTMQNVLAYMNGKVQSAGLITRFGEQQTLGAPQTVQVGGKTVTLSDSPNSYSLKINGVSTEQLSFSAPTSDPSVYVGQSSGITSSSVAGITPDAVQQLVKFDASGTPVAQTNALGQVYKHTADAGVSSIQKTVAAPDGSIYVLANVTGTTAGQTIKGAQDVALIKYDSAGSVVFTRTLGAATSATGLALTVSADGKQVAVAGSVSGDLTGSTTSSSSNSSTTTPPPQSFVTVFNGEGEEQWTQQMGVINGAGTGGGVQANAVAFGPNGMVYVAGQTDGPVLGGASHGNVDGFVQAYHAVSKPLNDGSGKSQWTVTQSYVNQFGTSGADKATGIAVSGVSVYVSSVENGHAVVRQFDQSGTTGTSLTPAATRDLGNLQGGGVAGISINTDGSVIVAGSTHNGALDAGTVTTAYASGEEAFIARLGSDLQPAASDRLTYVGASTDLSASAVTTAGGQVYITGQITTTPVAGTGQTSAFDGYAAAIDPTTGQVGWSQRYAGLDHEAAPSSIAVGATGASVLDDLGLPNGAVDYGASQQLVANTSLRPGDEFFVKSGVNGVATAVKIDAADTYQTLAQKIARASGFNAKVTVVPSTTGDTLNIAPNSATQQIQIIAGPSTGDVLKTLGLQEGVIMQNADKMSVLAPVRPPPGSILPTSSIKNGYSLNLPSYLDLTTTSGRAHAQTVLSIALSKVQGIYQDMVTPPPSKASTASGTVPQYLLNQVANYRAALQRLTGSG